MHIAYNAFKKAFFSLCLTLPFYIAACGDDSDNSSTAVIEDDDEDNLGGETFKDTSITSNQFNSNAGVVNIIKSEILDVKSGNSYKTIQFGPYTWMAENANYKISRSACYDEDTDYCKTYGRLYQSMNADQACPSGFKIPSEASSNTSRASQIPLPTPHLASTRKCPASAKRSMANCNAPASAKRHTTSPQISTPLESIAKANSTFPKQTTVHITPSAA